MTRKKVTFRKTAKGYIVRTPEGITNFANDSHTAKQYFREALKKFKQVFIPRSERKGMDIKVVKGSTTSGAPNEN